jgi:DNA-binding CsgD family transcriptional regulator
VDAAAFVEAGEEALAGGAWADALVAFASALELGEDPAVLSGLADARWWLGEVGPALECWERAHGLYVRSGDVASATAVAVTLALLNEANIGNTAVSAGWAARAARLADESGEPVLRAWAMLARAATRTDPAEAVVLGERACAIAVDAGDRDLELCALSTRGRALVDCGRVADGVALLDEALAGSVGGEGSRLDTIVFTSCLLVNTCYRCADFGRVVQWTKALAPFIDRFGCPYVNATCRAHYGAVLVATGAWTGAEAELEAALRLSATGLPVVHAEARAHLGELRLAQGRLDDARQLVAPVADRLVAAPVWGDIARAAGDTGLAVATARRGLDAAAGRHLETARFRVLLAEARLDEGDAGAAMEEARRIRSLGDEAGCDLVRARGDRLVGRACAVAGDDEGARRHLEAALGCFLTLELPLEVGRTRMDLAAAVVSVEPDLARSEAEAAVSVFVALGAERDARAAASWLRDDGATRAPHVPAPLDVLTRREREVVALVRAGLPNPEIAERLFISRRTVEHHVGSALLKLGVRNRTELAALVARGGAGT